MKKLFAVLFIGCISLAACNHQNIKIPVEIEAMRASCLYNTDSVASFLDKLTDRHKEISADYVKRSKESEEQDPVHSIYLQKRALSLHPEHDGYLRLGMMLKKNKNYAEAYDVFEFLVRKVYDNNLNNDTGRYIFRKPEPDDYYNQISTQFLSSLYFDTYLLLDAKDNGIDLQYIRKKLMEDDAVDKNTPVFKNFIVNFWTEAEVENYKKSPEAFENFMRSAKDSLRAFKHTASDVSDFNYSGYNFEYEAMVLSDFNRYFLEEAKSEDSFYGEFNLEHAFKLTDGTCIMAYSIDSSMNGCIKDLRNITHKLVAYDRAGNVISSMITGRQNFNTLVTADVTYPSITLKFFNRSWKNPYKADQLENELTSVEFQKEERYIFVNGKFELEEIYGE